MATTSESTFKRELLGSDATGETAELLQRNLVNLIDLALLLKQAHWNVVGPQFRSVHLHLDEILETVRAASDDVAERISALGVSADGRVTTVAERSRLESYPEGFQGVDKTLGKVADALKSTIDDLRGAITRFGETDPITEDLCIGITGELEKHLWMVQAQEQ